MYTSTEKKQMVHDLIVIEYSLGMVRLDRIARSYTRYDYDQLVKLLSKRRQEHFDKFKTEFKGYYEFKD